MGEDAEHLADQMLGDNPMANDKQTRVEIQFQDGQLDRFAGKEYTYLTRIGLSVGDLAVVHTSSGYKVVSVTQVNAPPIEDKSIQYKYIIDRVHTENE